MAEKNIADPAEGDSISFKFTGGIADQGELNFYELGRSQYAAARLLYILGRYRATGEIVERVRDSTALDIRTRAPQKGSFLFEAFQIVQGQLAPALVSVPLKVLVTWVWDHLVPASAAWATVKFEGSLEAQRIKAKKDVALSKEETRKLEISTKAAEGQATAKEAIELLRDIGEGLEYVPDASQERKLSIKVAHRDLLIEIKREEIMKPYEKELQAIPEEDKRKIFAKSRPLVAETGLPLKGSATNFSVGVGANDNEIGWLDKERLAELKELTKEDTVEFISGRIIQYNTQNGYGRFKVEKQQREQYGDDVGFRVARPKLAELQDEILESMKDNEITGEFVVTRDSDENVKYLELANVHGANQDEMDEL
jgi:hypothetical protein